MYGIVPKKPKDVYSDYNCGYNWTIPMLLAHNSKDIPEEWYHNKILRNNRGDTV